MPGRYNCKSCEMIRGEELPRYDRVYQFDNYPRWYVNHYGGNESFLGWLVLQPSEEDCVDTIAELTPETLQQLGQAIQTTQLAMLEHWHEMFLGDVLQRIHTVSFMESEFDEPDEPSEYFYHVHISLIPRSNKIGKLIRRHLNEAKQYIPWDDHTIASRIACLDEFEQYRCTQQRVGRLMKILRGTIGLTEIIPQ